jgi:hypothetical protein
VRSAAALVHQAQDQHVQPHADEPPQLLSGFGNACQKNPASGELRPRGDGKYGVIVYRERWIVAQSVSVL